MQECGLVEVSQMTPCLRRGGGALHCINTESYIAQKCVNIHSGPDSKVMHSFTTCMCFFQSSVMMMDTSLVHRIWHAKARYARFLTLPTAWVIHIPPAQHTGLSLAGWTIPSFVRRVAGKKIILALGTVCSKKEA